MNRPRVAVLAFSTLTLDTRVMRTIRALCEAGYPVTAIGFGTAPEGVDRFVAMPAPVRGTAVRIGMVLRQAPAMVLPGLAPFLHDLAAMHRAARAALCEARPAIVHANDWLALPAALAAKAAHGARIIYDSHEFAVEEHAHLLRWRLLMRAHVAAIEARGIVRADRVVTVSDGIGRALRTRYGLAAAPVTVRNVPAWAELPFRPSGWPRRLLFHGALKTYRGIEVIIAALAKLPGHVLTLRGESTPAYAAALARMARAAGVTERVTFEPAVPPEAVARYANMSDLGLYLGPVGTGQNMFALPNKLFEYAMGGLGIVVSPGEDMRALVGQYGFGLSVEPSVPALAAALSQIGDADLDRMKRAALAAARTLNWETERAQLLSVYEDLTDGKPGRLVHLWTRH
jgi:glycosyltransferase involved in cell wall biosynthesis